MNLFYYISDFIIPILIVYILVTGLAAKIPVYDEFVKGAAEGIHTVLKILPTLVGDRKSTRLNSSHPPESRMPSSA